jgi:hypothetical protein
MIHLFKFKKCFNQTIGLIWKIKERKPKAESENFLNFLNSLKLCSLALLAGEQYFNLLCLEL